MIKRYKIDAVIDKSDYPETSVIGKTQSILSFLALKLANRRRYCSDDTWCMDRGIGLFAGLNVLPKTAWFTSYSDRVTSDMNRRFLKQLHRVWMKAGLLEDTSNLDFYHSSNKKKNDKLRYVVFDSRFTNYENLRRLDQAEINFITIRRRGKKCLIE